MPEARPTVAVVTDAIYPYHRGGKEVWYFQIVPRLRGRADVTVYTMHWWDGPKSIDENGVTYRAVCPRVPLYAGENRRSIVQAVRFAAACVRLIREPFDVLQADHMPYLQLFPLWAVARLRRKRLVGVWHECWGRDYWITYMGRLGVVGWWAEALAMRLPDHIIANSEQTADRLRDHLGPDAPVSVASPGIDTRQIDGVEPAPTPSDLVAVGRLLEHKRLDRLIDAVALLRDQGLDLSCRIVGEGPARALLEQHARDCGVADRVEIREDVATHEEVYSLVKAARIFVAPSEREGFGVAVLEALACGVPVLTTSAPDNLARHLVHRARRGVVCEPSTDALAASIRTMLESGRERVDGEDDWLAEYDWEAIAGRVAQVVAA